MSKAAKLTPTTKTKTERLAGIHKGNPFFPYVDSILQGLVKPTILRLISEAKEPVTSKKQIYKLYVVNTGHKPSEALFNQWLKYLQFTMVTKLQVPTPIQKMIRESTLQEQAPASTASKPRPPNAVPFLTPLEDAVEGEAGWDNMKQRPQQVAGQADAELRELLQRGSE